MFNLFVSNCKQWLSPVGGMCWVQTCFCQYYFKQRFQSALLRRNKDPMYQRDGKINTARLFLKLQKFSVLAKAKLHAKNKNCCRILSARLTQSHKKAIWRWLISTSSWRNATSQTMTLLKASFALKKTSVESSGKHPRNPKTKNPREKQKNK